ncbi:MAG: cell division protein FtsQ/DivIB [Rickettsiales bacterium]|nr:cell division protein FtsQ/DivIB [Rickettsiales bacterium]
MKQKPKKKKKVNLKKPEDFIRKRKIRFAVNRSLKIFQITLLVFFAIFLIWCFLFDGYSKVVRKVKNEIAEKTIKLGLELEKVEISGNKTVNHNDIINAIYDAVDYSEIPILMLDLEEVQKNISEVGWVDKANLRIKLPNTLEVEIIERKPSFIWVQDGKFSLSDIRGNLITYKVTPENQNLPTIKGKDSKREISEIYDIISSSPELHKMVTSAMKIGNRRWDVELKKSIKVKLPETNAISAWKKLSELNKKNNLLSKKISYIDMRIENQLVTGF